MINVHIANLEENPTQETIDDAKRFWDIYERLELRERQNMDTCLFLYSTKMGGNFGFSITVAETKLLGY